MKMSRSLHVRIAFGGCVSGDEPVPLNGFRATSTFLRKRASTLWVLIAFAFLSLAAWSLLYGVGIYEESSA